MSVPTVARGACYLRGCHKCSACCISVTDGPIALKFGMHLGDPLVTAYTVVTGGVSLHVRTCRDTPTPRFCISEMAWPIVVQIWYVGWGSLTKCLPQVIDEVHLHVRTCAPLFHKCSACCFSVTVGPIVLKFGMHLGNPLATAYAVVTDGVSLHVRTCTPRFCISQTARPIVFKFGVWVSSHNLSAFHKSWVGYLCTCARADHASVSQERLGRLSSILVCELGGHELRA